MNRRSLIRAVACGGSLFLAGCGSINDILGGKDESTRPLGSSVAHDGVKVTPGPFITADEITFTHQATGGSNTRTPDSGAVYLLTKLSVELVGDNPRKAPGRGMGDYGHIDHLYKGEDQPDPRFETYAETITVRGESLPGYHYQLREQGLRTESYEGEASGWLVNMVPEGFEVGDMAIKISWGAKSPIDDEGEKTFTWAFIEDSRGLPQ